MKGKFWITSLLVAMALNSLAFAQVIRQPTKEQLTQLLHPSKALPLGGERHLIFKAWPAFVDQYIVVSYTVTRGWDSTAPIDIAIVKQDGNGFTVLARQVFVIAVSNYYLANVSIDTAKYKIGDSERAFGLRIDSFYGASGASNSYESLELFELRDNKIAHIAVQGANHVGGDFEVTGDLGMWIKESGGYDGHFGEEETRAKLIVSSQRTNGYFDLVLRAVKTGKSVEYNDNGKIKRVKHAPSERTDRVFQWDGQKYQEKASR